MSESIPAVSDARSVDIPDEPLEISAALAWQHAQQTCRRNLDDGTSCLWTHGLWQFLRIIGLAGTAANRSAFYQRSLRAFLTNNPAPQILVSGTADYAMLAQIALAAQHAVATPTVTVMDICETPLQLNRWYASRGKFAINTVCSNILEFTPSSQFDMICTDSFLGRFPQAAWPQVATRWHELLRPGGELLTASQLRPEAGPERLVFDAERIIMFRNKVLANTQRHLAQASLGLDDADLAEAVEQYCGQQSNYPLRSESHLRSVLENAGFDINELTNVVSASLKYRNLDAPAVSSGGTFLCVVASRR